MQSVLTGLQALGIAFGVCVAMIIVWYVLQVVAMWKIFTKAGEAGWKSIIPFYNEYTLFKISWKKASIGLIWLVAALAGEFLVYFGYNTVDGVISNPIVYYIGEVLVLLAGILLIVRNFKEAKAFGHGAGFGLGLTFLTPIFNLILGFSQDKYIGAQD